MLSESADQATKFLARLEEVLPSRGRVLVLPHNYPDPDALASAAGMVLLLKRRFNLKGEILFTGTVSRAENRELLRQFRYTWRLTARMSRSAGVLPCVLVDTSPWSGNVTIPEGICPIAVVDHHPPRRKPPMKKDMVLDIRSGAGATSTQVYDYLEVSEIVIPKWLCTIMAYAVASETLDLSRDCTDRDLEVYVRLLARANLGNLGRIRHAPLPRVYYAILQDAMRNAMVYGRVAWTHLPVVNQPEIAAEVADLLHRLERITWSFCTAEMGNRLLISIRSSAPKARCGRLLKEEIGGDGNAGGHHHMAAGYLDLGNQSPAEMEVSRNDLVQKLLAAIEKKSLQQRDVENEPVVAQPLVGDESELGESGEAESLPPA